LVVPFMQDFLFQFTPTCSFFVPRKRTVFAILKYGIIVTRSSKCIVEEVAYEQPWRSKNRMVAPVESFFV
jgi:hypothetical protein